MYEVRYSDVLYIRGVSLACALVYKTSPEPGDKLYMRLKALCGQVYR